MGTRDLHQYPLRAFLAAAAAGAIVVAASQQVAAEGKGGTAGGPIATTLQDFFQPGTQPLGGGLPGEFTPIISASACQGCHGNYGEQDPFLQVEPYGTWAASMMGQAARDPLFYAGLTIMNQDATDGGEYCIRCHVPSAYLGGRSVPTDGSAFEPTDFQGISCNFCHRMLDPVYKPGISPVEDDPILTELANASLVPPEGSNSRYIVDPTDTRRGPYNDIPENPHPGNPQPAILHSPFHKKAEFCWNCHDVSNPLLEKQPNGTYALGALDAPHVSHSQKDMFPVHRTYSEWKNSYYSNVGVQHNGLFGGNHPTGIMKDCQDCHIPDTIGYGCGLTFPPFFERPDVPQHSFMGSNTWVLNAIRTVDANADGTPDYPDAVTGLNDERVGNAIARNTDFLQRASSMSLALLPNDQFRVRVVNKTGHKLPTGLPEGRRVWINVKFLDCLDALIQEQGAYDFSTATLTSSDTKVYEAVLGIIGAEYAAAVGQPEGITHHFALANKVLKDNRIPPAGHSNQLAVINQTETIGATYLNGQNWDDTLYAIPAGTRKVIATVYYQVTTKEFIEFLHDGNTTNNLGQVAYDLWVEHGMSQPVVMDMGEVSIFRPEDVDENGTVDIDDLFEVIAAWGDCSPPPTPCPTDVDGSGSTDIDDLFDVIAAWGEC